MPTSAPTVIRQAWLFSKSALFPSRSLLSCDLRRPHLVRRLVTVLPSRCCAAVSSDQKGSPNSRSAKRAYTGKLAARSLPSTNRNNLSHRWEGGRAAPTNAASTDSMDESGDACRLVINSHFDSGNIEVILLPLYLHSADKLSANSWSALMLRLLKPVTLAIFS